VGCRDEVRTDAALLAAWRDGKEVAVPCCVGDELELFRVESLSELAPRTLGILEPRREVRAREGRRIDVETVDLIVAPGVAFDPNGGRVGYGKGFYDKLLSRARPDTPVAALAFECQMFPEVPMSEHDVFMDKIITETQIYERAV
jgi:5-formyltetrahydrofolate cyclo-ligase